MMVNNSFLNFYRVILKPCEFHKSDGGGSDGKTHAWPQRFMEATMDTETPAFTEDPQGQADPTPAWG